MKTSIMKSGVIAFLSLALSACVVAPPRTAVVAYQPVPVVTPAPVTYVAAAPVIIHPAPVVYVRPPRLYSSVYVRF